MKITLVRHGETDWNSKNKLQGRENAELNDKGRRQCKALRDKIKDNKYDVCYMSPLLRTVETAMILIGDRVEMIPDKRLIERDLGNLEGVDRSKYNQKLYWDYKLNCSTDGVEAIQDVFKRCNDFISYIKEKYDEDASILVVTHATPYRAIHHILNNTDLNGKIDILNVVNCSIEEIETNKNI